MTDIRCKDISHFMEKLAPLNLAQDWDNVGLLVGSTNQIVKKALVCVDVTINVVDECIESSVDLIISHHPLIFKAIKKLITNNPIGNIVYKLIQNNISVYCAHTNLDIVSNGTNRFLAEALKLQSIEKLHPTKSDTLLKLVVFVPHQNLEPVRNAICAAGAGCIGNYKNCTFYSSGTGTFMPLNGSNPYIGSANTLEHVDEFKLEALVPSDALDNVVNGMLHAHPYEEVAYEISQILNPSSPYSFG